MKQHSPYTKLSPQPLFSTVWSGGFWLERFNLTKDAILPTIYDLFESDEISHCLANFRIAAGLQEGDHQGPPFSDGDFYKWLEGASYVFGITKDEKLKKLIDDSITLIAKVQREDGYIFTQYSIRERLGENMEKLGNSLNFEAYNLGHLITAGCVHYKATGEENLLVLAMKAAFCLKALFEEADKTNSAKTAICPSHYMALIDLYRVTGDKTHLETATLAIALRDKVKNGTDDNQDRIPLREQKEMTGHAVRATYLYAGVSDLYAETGEKALLDMLIKVWEDEEYTKIYINSGCGALFDGVSPSGFAGDHPNLSRTHQAFGRPYQLPNLTAYNETCATIGNVFFNWRLFLLNAQAVHADRVEQSFYNLILASVSMDGKKFFYSNTLARESSPLPFHLKWDRTRREYLSSFCCPPNMMRMLCESSEYSYALAEDGVYTGIYGHSSTNLTFKGQSIHLEQKTDYPYDGRISIRYDSTDSAEFTLHVRIPSWAKEGSLSWDDKSLSISEEQANTYIPVHKAWKQGDEIILDLVMEPRVIVAHPLVEDNIHQGAVMRGPLLYCSEEIDQQDYYFDSIGLKLTAQFSKEERIIAGKNVLCLTSPSAVAYPSLSWKENKLYQEVSNLQVHPFQVTLIPYFAWDNRGFGGMKIWFPLYIS